jgi:hypothetical protein
MTHRLFPGDSLAYLLSAEGHLGRPAKPELHTVAMHFEHGDLDVSTDDDHFAAFPTKNQHGVVLLPPDFLALGFLIYATAKRIVRSNKSPKRQKTHRRGRREREE